MPSNLCINHLGALCWIDRDEDELYFHPIRCLRQDRTTRAVHFRLH